jgi:hypothetical protein
MTEQRLQHVVDDDPAAAKLMGDATIPVARPISYHILDRLPNGGLGLFAPRDGFRISALVIGAARETHDWTSFADSDAHGPQMIDTESAAGDITRCLF